jgi:hypothetical protein
MGFSAKNLAVTPAQYDSPPPAHLRYCSNSVDFKPE